MLWDVDVWSEMERLRREMDTLFSNAGVRGGVRAYPPINVYDNGEAIVVTAELPGMTKGDVSITFTDGVLSVGGKVEPVKAAEKMSIVRSERNTGEFEKSLRIPTKVEQEKINASFTNGILTVILPKAEEAKPKTIQIEAK
jgi:HSP20 family protein